MVEFNYGGKRYSLGYNRKSAAAIERAGFVSSEITDKPNIMIPLLVVGAFQMNHKRMRDDEIDKVFDNIADKDGFVSALLKEYQKTYETLLGKPEDDGDTEDSENFIQWTET